MDGTLDPLELVDLVEELHAAESPHETADQVIRALCDMLEMDHGGVTMIRKDRRLETVAATSELAFRADELQSKLGEGPALSDAWDQTLRAGDLTREQRWPSWTGEVATLGVHSMLAVSLSPASRRIGVVTLYATKARSFDDDDVALAHVFARHAALALDTAEHQESLRIALDARKLIGQAQGILMERYGISEVRAFEVLRRYCKNHQVSLRRAAELLVHSRSLPSPPS